MPDLLLVDVNGHALGVVDAISGGEDVAHRIDPDLPIMVLPGRCDELHRARCLQVCGEL